jgi:diacylglycerol diphosphate phosphatase/phosphatidate phosphatase
MGALMIAISRCEDYRHDVWDVTFGSLLGMGVAYFSYRRYYPPVRSARCDVPFDKVDAPMTEGFSKLSNDEERQGLRNATEPPDWEHDDGSYQLREMSSGRTR